jgi:hypothetical protein
MTSGVVEGGDVRSAARDLKESREAGRRRNARTRPTIVRATARAHLLIERVQEQPRVVAHGFRADGRRRREPDRRVEAVGIRQA